MQSLLRSTTRLVRPSSGFPPQMLTPRTTRLYATQSYGGEDMSGHPKSDAANPKAHLEHPGPETPASKGTDSSSSSSSSSSPKSTPEKSPSTSSSHKETSKGGSPAINNPGPAPEEQKEGVKKHNEAVANSHDRPVNQIDSEGKVEKSFWKG